MEGCGCHKCLEDKTDSTTELPTTWSRMIDQFGWREHHIMTVNLYLGPVVFTFGWWLKKPYIPKDQEQP
jgi:hypothetical protein